MKDLFGRLYVIRETFTQPTLYCYRRLSPTRYEGQWNVTAQGEWRDTEAEAKADAFDAWSKYAGRVTLKGGLA